jgi:hypothetical protein
MSNLDPPVFGQVVLIEVRVEVAGHPTPVFRHHPAVPPVRADHRLGRNLNQCYVGKYLIMKTAQNVAQFFVTVAQNTPTLVTMSLMRHCWIHLRLTK